MPGSYTRKRGKNAQSRARANARRKRMTIAKQTKENTRKINVLANLTNPISRFYFTRANVIAGFHHVELITQPSNWEHCFRTESVPGTDLPRRYDLTHVKCKWACQTEGSTTGNLWLQLMMVSLKPKTAAKVIERTTRLSNLEPDVDYIYAAAGSGAAGQGDCFFMINPHLYTIHYNSGPRRIGQETMGAATEVTNIRDSTTRGTASFKFKRTIANDEYNEDGFMAIDSDHLEPRNHLYLMLFSNAQETAEVFLTHNTLFTGRMATAQ